MNVTLTCFLLALASISLPGQPGAIGKLDFVPNGGQWDHHVLYRASIPSGAVFLERDRMTLAFANHAQLAALHEAHYHGISDHQVNTTIDHHAYQVIFSHSNPSPKLSPAHKRSHYLNYFIGNDPAGWATKLYPFGSIRYESLYNGIDAVIYSAGVNLKYDFVIAPGSNPEAISLLYSGVNEMRVEKGNLVITTSVNELQELEPYAYQVIGGSKVEVKCKYLLRGNEVSFYFPQGYDPQYTLVIDPTLVASTYMGSTETTEGFVAAYDSSGNVIAAGICYSLGYPTTPAAYQLADAGLGDVVISKFNPDGSSPIWGTYLGGDQKDVPHSLISNSNDDLVILGNTAGGGTAPPPGYPAKAFPTTAGAYDQSYNGQTQDLFLSLLSTDGTTLIASTFIGGSGIDGSNDLSFLYNAEDKLKGELVLDASDNCYVSICTKSNNFPTTPGVVQPALGGAQDAVVFKMDAGLTTLIWSTYLGGTARDMAYSLRLHPSGNIYVVGGTESSDFPTTGGTVNPNHFGSVDGYVAILNSTATSLQSVLFVGDVASFDQTNYVEFDALGDVFIYGHSDGSMDTTAGTYKNPNSGLYVQKYNPALSILLAGTVVGSGSGEPDLVPSAFCIDVCDFVYIGGFERKDASVGHIPTTYDAFQPQSNGIGINGTNFFFMVFDRDLSDTLYATYIGGPGTGAGGDHTHGGTSRWDKLGTVYQAVCNFDGLFPTTSNAYSPTKVNTDAFESDMVVFKFDFEQTKLEADFLPVPFAVGCVPFTVNFVNQSTNAVFFEWEFGDGQTSTDSDPVHTFTDTGTFLVRLIADNPSVCFERDTSFVTITVFPSPTALFNYDPPSPVMALTPIQFSDSSIDADTWFWDLGDGTTTTTVNPLHAYQQDGTYLVCLTVTDSGGCSDSICKTVVVFTEGDAVIPTAFTPNGDQMNDIYYVIGYGLRTFEFRIYNRWGQVMFETTDIDQGWDGTWNDVPQPLGVYAYYARGEKFNGEEIILKGNVTLLR